MKWVGSSRLGKNVRDIRVGVWLEKLAQDICYGTRTLKKNPAFSLVAIATLALGIGANTAMFSLLDQIVLRLLPVKQPERLVKVTVAGNNYGNTYGTDRISWPMFEDLRDRNEVFSDMFCGFPTTVTVGYEDRAAQVMAELVSGSYFPVLGLERLLAVPSPPMTTKFPTVSRLWCSAIASGGTTSMQTARSLAERLRSTATR